MGILNFYQNKNPLTKRQTFFQITLVNPSRPLDDLHIKCMSYIGLTKFSKHTTYHHECIPEN